ncbi:ribosomal protein L7/L12 [Sphingomicrobium astaxanthinifaciens]|uniref:ribosomal protein L7/L12 n=1 Tax=Sphingomicrobium astaxanthinifaciens TaxID=1227949 RepID=UPI001FCB1372|nr:ribosomal protein L7/L12 [Sphingomicrobium astaxanthinifaciens]MCJ7421466.1 ribosomal protein L7/L12 [Sphingomicrobium astaxanthinifaciens]
MDGWFWMMVTFVVGYLLGRNSMAGKAAAGPTAAAKGRPVGELSARGRAAVEAALHRGHKIEAVKAVREETGAGLKEAKAFVDAFAAKRAERRKGDPIER